jgi:hypothetical protein
VPVPALRIRAVDMTLQAGPVVPVTARTRMRDALRATIARKRLAGKSVRGDVTDGRRSHDSSAPVDRLIEMRRQEAVASACSAFPPVTSFLTRGPDGRAQAAEVSRRRPN